MSEKESILVGDILDKLSLTDPEKYELVRKFAVDIRKQLKDDFLLREKRGGYFYDCTS